MTKLTDTAIATAKKKTAPYIMRDDGAPGHALYVGTSGVKKFRYIYRYGKKGSQYISFGVYPHMTLAEARERANWFEKARQEGRDPKSLVYRPAIATTLAELLDDHLLRAPASTRRTLRSLYRPIRAQFGHFALRDISASALRAWLEANYEHRQGAARTLLKNLSAQLKDALTPLGREQWVIPADVQNVTQGLGKKLKWKVKRKKGSHAVSWDGDKIAKLIGGIEAAYAKATPDQQRGIMAIELCLYTGTRPSEITGLRWEEVKVWRSTKAAEKLHHKTEGQCDEPTTRRIILGPEAIALLDRAEAMRVGDCPWVFPQSMKTLAKKSGRSNIEIELGHISKPGHYQKMISAQCGFDFTPYNLRSAYINYTLDQHGMGMLEAVSKNVGHSTTATTLKYYRRENEQRLEEAAIAGDGSLAKLKANVRPSLTIIDERIAA